IPELQANVDDTVIEELNHLDADDLHADLDFREELFTRRNRNRLQPPLITRHDLLGRKTIVDDRLEHLHALPRDDRAPQPPDQFFRFTREHAAGDDLDPTTSVTVQRESLRREG